MFVAYNINFLFFHSQRVEGENKCPTLFLASWERVLHKFGL